MGILFEQINGQGGDVGVIILDRPKALNALNFNMIQSMQQQLACWATDTSIKAVVVKSNSDKAFCAGGDIRRVYDAKQASDDSILNFFWHEYRLNHFIFHFPKPYISLLHGITMGGGVGISQHGSHRVGSESLMFAMPETGIGFFPDVGGSYFLPRLPGKLGLYLGLSGTRLSIADCCYAEITDFFVPQGKFDTLFQELVETPFGGDPSQHVSGIIAHSATTPDDSKLVELQTDIDNCFAADSIEGILQNVQQHATPWSEELLNRLSRKSPTSLKVTLELLRRGAELSFDDCMQQEYRLVDHFLQGHDFAEGVRALIVDKDNKPQWQPASLEAVSDDDVTAYFSPSEHGDLELINVT